MIGLPSSFLPSIASTRGIVADSKPEEEYLEMIINAGADYVRITIPSLKDAGCLHDIKVKLRKQGYNTPLIADVHFSPVIAEYVAAIAEKARINPGNYAEGSKHEKTDFSDEEYSEETEFLRYFRDNVLGKTPEGKEIIKLYYQWSPEVVRAMEEDEEFKEEVKKKIDDSNVD